MSTPATPTNVRAYPLDKVIWVTWDMAHSSNLAGFEVHADSGAERYHCDPVTHTQNWIRGCRVVVPANGAPEWTPSVRALGGGGALDSPWTTGADAVAARALATPVLTVTPSGSQYDISWTFPQEDEYRLNPAGFAVLVRDMGGVATFPCSGLTAASRSCVATGITGDGPFRVYITVLAISNAGVDCPYAWKDITTTPDPPTLDPLTRDGTAVTASWSPSGDSHTVTVLSSGSDTPTCVPATPAATTCGFTAVRGNTYEVTVTATTVGGTSDPSAARTVVVPAAVATPAVTLTPVAGALEVAWTFPADDQGRIAGFAVAAQSAGGQPVPCDPAPAPVDRRCRIVGLADGTGYTVTVTAVASAAGDSSSATATATPGPLPLGGVQVGAGDGTLTVSWTYPQDAQSLISGFQVSATGAGGSSGTCAPGVAVRSCVIGGLANGVGHTVTVTAVATTGTIGDNRTLTANGKPSLGAPGTPTGLTVAPAAASAVVSWTAPAAVGQGISGYRVTAVAAGPPVSCTATGGTGTTGTCTLVGLTNGVTYTVTVVTEGVDGNSPPSAGVAVTPNAPPSAPPTEPATSNGTLTSTSGTSFVSARGSTVLRGTGFAPNTPVTLVIYSTPTTLGSAVTDANGDFTLTVELPAGLTGAHTVVSIGLAPDGSTRVMKLDVTIGRPVGAGSGLAVTGTRVEATVLAGLLLLVAGGATRVLAGVRRSPSTR